MVTAQLGMHGSCATCTLPTPYFLFKFSPDTEGSTSYGSNESVNVEHCLVSSVTRCGDDDVPRSLDFSRGGGETGRAVSVSQYISNFELILRQVFFSDSPVNMLQFWSWTKTGSLERKRSENMSPTSS